MNRNSCGIVGVEILPPAAPAARPRTTADNPWSCRCPRFPGRGHRRSRRCSRPETGDRAVFGDGYLSTRSFRIQRDRGSIAAANRRARRAPERPIEPPSDPPSFAEIGGDTADHLVGDGARNVSRNHLAGRHPATLDVGAEDRADDRTDLSENPPPPAPPACPSAGAAVPATRFCSIS